MTHAAEKIAQLRVALARTESLEARARIPLGHYAADQCLNGGLARGSLHEIFACSGHEAAATGFTAGLAARVAAKKPLLWIRQDFSALEFGEISATGFLEFGIDPARMLLFCAANAEDALRAAIDALSCSTLGAVIIEIPGDAKILDLSASRRLTLTSAQKNVTAFLLRFAAKPDASAAETRWLVRSAPSPAKVEKQFNPVFKTDLVRNRHGATGHWVMEWNSDDALFEEADRGAVVSASCDGSFAAALESGGDLRSVA